MRKRVPTLTLDDEFDADELGPVFDAPGRDAADRALAPGREPGAATAPHLYAAAVKWADVLEQVTLAEMSGGASSGEYEALASAISELHDMVRAERCRWVGQRH